MLETVHALNILIPVFYLVTFTYYVIAFKEEKKNLSNAKRVTLFITLLLHLFYLVIRTIELNHAPITNPWEIFTVLAFAIAFSYFILELATDVRETGAFILLFALLFQTASSVFIPDVSIVKEVLRNRLLGLHVISAILGYSGFTISAVYGVLFLMLYKQIKLRNFGIIFDRLPSLETLEKLNFYSVIIGFIMLTFAIIIGIIWLPSAFPHFKYSDPKIVATSIVWAVYASGITLKWMFHIYGKKVIILSLSGFVLAILSLMITNMAPSTFHSFY